MKTPGGGGCLGLVGRCNLLALAVVSPVVGAGCRVVVGGLKQGLGFSELLMACETLSALLSLLYSGY